jgi:hypothetical protein
VVLEIEWCVLVSSPCLSRCDAVLRNTSGITHISFVSQWKRHPLFRVMVVLAWSQLRPSIVHCFNVVVLLMCAFVSRSCICGGIYVVGVGGILIVVFGVNLLSQVFFCKLPYIISFASSIVDLSVNRTSQVGLRLYRAPGTPAVRKYRLS